MISPNENIVNTLLINPEASILRAMEAINENSYKTVIVVDVDKKVLGIVSDGDIRRWILKNGNLEVKIEKVMNKNPLFCGLSTTELEAAEIMKEKVFGVLPILDSDRVLKGLHLSHLSESVQGDRALPVSAHVVIMAGGTGSRLAPYTSVLPKPLIPIAGVPIIDRIINQFREFKSKDFHLTVNYKSSLIRAYFDQDSREYTINYVEENVPLGTGGSLGLLDAAVTEPFFVTNCDILIEADYCDIYNFHTKNDHEITVVAATKDYTVPYGVIELDEFQNLKVINEKPVSTKLVNTGMYVVSPRVLKLIPREEFFHITHLIEAVIEKGGTIGVFPIPESAWMDMGQIEEMTKMEKRFSGK